MFQIIATTLLVLCFVDSSESFNITNGTCLAYENRPSLEQWEIVQQRTCESSEFCCGICNSRYCCSKQILFLNQEKCKNNYPSDKTIPVFTIVSSSVMFICVASVWCSRLYKRISHYCRHRRTVMQGNNQSSVINMSCRYVRQSSLPEYWDIENGERVIIKKETDVDVQVSPPPYPGQ